MKIVVVGAGYVGMACGILFSKGHDVIFLEVDKNKIKRINSGNYLQANKEISDRYPMNKYNIQATDNIKFAYENADYVIIAVPTDYNSDAKQLDVNVLYGVLSDAVKYNNNATIIIKSTVPIGCCEKISRLYSLDRLLFVPEFIREENILYDTYNPSRVVVGYNVLCDVNHEYASKYASLIKPLITGTKNIMFMNYNEAEAVKLFSNSYLAMRVSFFNELDAFAEQHNMNTKKIIEGVCADQRIGMYYNNPSFGYGGYCLPKDTMQLQFSFDDVPNVIISAINVSNEMRKNTIAQRILCVIDKKFNKASFVLGVFGLGMKEKSDNMRNSSIIDIIKILKSHGVSIIIYEPMLRKKEMFMDCYVVNSIDELKKRADYIIANRWSSELMDVKDKVYTRDVNA